MLTMEFSGKTKEEVLKKALETLKLGQNQLNIEFQDDNNLIPFIKKKITAIVTFNEEDMFGNRCLIYVRDLLEKMNIEAKIYLIEENEQRIIIEIESPDTALIIGKKGQTLESIQTIVNVVMNKNYEIWTKIIIDIENYRNRKERNLRYIANKAASQVKKTRKPLLLEPMNPFERRIVHLALKDEANIETESLGEGIIKKIKVNYIK